jgi:hypothetical protein
MNLAGFPLEQIIFNALFQAPALEKKTMTGPLLTALSFFLGLAAIGFFMGAGYGWLNARYDAPTASFYMGLIILTAALIASFAAHAIHNFRRVKRQTYQKLMIDNIRSAIGVLGEELEEPIRDNPKMAAFLAALAGFVAAQKIS